ncbi:MAG: CpsB/CapC family capsule biosynthesis tyrosine phosphatase [Solirubrobacteraceae bacterium]|jgi:protein-tyrosine phosphatase
MIDLHCHILPGLDDGALSLDDSVAMARQAADDGIAVVCATPHIRHDHHVHIGEIAARVSSLQQELARRRIPVRLLPGGELAETEADRLTDAELRLVTLGGAGAWLLLEPAPGPLTSGLQELVERLAARGYRAVLAHPERHAGADFTERLEGLASRGCLIQWTAEFVADAAPGDLALVLAQRRLVHLLGSDAHSSLAGRPVRLAAGFARLASVLTPAQIAWSAELAPHAIVRGGELSPQP